MSTKVVLVAVSEYNNPKLVSLPLCKNDLFEMKKSLIKGLNILNDDIITCGESGTVTITEVIDAIKYSISKATVEDKFIFYFSGHGSNGVLALSDGLIDLNNLITLIERMPFKAKIAILDSCHSGDFNLCSSLQMKSADNIDLFVGHGFAVMASCRAEQQSGFDDKRSISLYTGFICDALLYNGIIRNGKKSLEEINELVFYFSEIYKSNNSKVQQPVFRSNIGGTIYFDVAPYIPYIPNTFYDETENYVVCEIKPLHGANIKKFAVMVMLKENTTYEDIAKYSVEIKNKVLYCEIYKNEISEMNHKGTPVNVVFCYFGCDKSDMVNNNYLCYTTWIDDNQDESIWYKEQNNAIFINGTYIKKNDSYNLIKKINSDNTMDSDEFINEVKKNTSNIVSIAERIINSYREFINGRLSEDVLIFKLKPLNKEIQRLFIKQSDLPVAPLELHDWFQKHCALCGTAVDFALFYSSAGKSKWSSETRKWLMNDAIKKYESALEVLKNVWNCQENCSQ